MSHACSRGNRYLSTSFQKWANRPSRLTASKILSGHPQTLNAKGSKHTSNYFVTGPRRSGVILPRSDWWVFLRKRSSARETFLMSQMQSFTGSLRQPTSASKLIGTPNPKSPLLLTLRSSGSRKKEFRLKSSILSKTQWSILHGNQRAIVLCWLPLPKSWPPRQSRLKRQCHFFVRRKLRVRESVTLSISGRSRRRIATQSIGRPKVVSWLLPLFTPSRALISISGTWTLRVNDRKVIRTLRQTFN